MYKEKKNNVEIHKAAWKLLLRENPVISSYFPLWDTIEEIMPLFKELCHKCGDDSAMAAAWCPDREKEDPDLGVIFRPGGAFDHKFFFHYAHGLESMIPLSKMGAAEKRLLEAAREIWQYLHTVAKSFYWACDMQTFGEYRFSDRYHALPDVEKLKLRLLYYMPKAKHFAKPHFDRGGLTFHLWESKPALQYGYPPQAYQAKKDEILIFPGVKTGVITDPQYQENGIAAVIEEGWRPHGLLQPTPHKALRDKSDNEERFAAVAFAHVLVDGVSTYDSAKFFSDLQKRLIKEMAY